MNISFLSSFSAKLFALLLLITVPFTAFDLIEGGHAGFLFFIAGLAIAGAIIFSLRTSSRLKRLNRAVEAVSQGKLGYRIDFSGNDELSHFAENFNSMASNLQNKTEELSRERNRIRSVHQSIKDGIVVFDRLGRVLSANPAAEIALGKLENALRGKWDIGAPQIEKLIISPDLVRDEDRVRCWEVKNCSQSKCPSFGSEDLRCWLQCGTYCHDRIQGAFDQKRDACERCDVFIRNGTRMLQHRRGNVSYSVSISPTLNRNGLEEGRIAMFHDVTETESDKERLLNRNWELSVLNDIASVLTRSLDELDLDLGKALKKVMAALGVDAGAVLLIEDSRTLSVRASLGLKKKTLVIMQMLAAANCNSEGYDGGLLGLGDLFADYTSVKHALDGEGLPQSVVAPLWVQGNMIGALLLAVGSDHEFGNNEVKLINAAAASIAVAIKNAELFANVARAKQAWETTFDAMGDAVSVHDCEFRITRVNKAMSALTGKAEEDLIGRKCHEVIHGTSEPWSGCPAWEVIRTGRSLSLEMPTKCFTRTMSLTINPVKDSHKRVVGIVHVMKDITEGKQLREQLLQSDKMAAVGQLVSGVAHELNNPLTGVIGYSQLLLKRCDDDQMRMVGSDLEAIIAEAQRASRIVQNLLSFARKHTPQKAMVDINEAILTVLALRTYELNVRNIKMVTELADGLPRTMADVHQIEQVLLNVINNAEQALTETGRPGTIKVSSILTGNGNLQISISDDGEGISPENLKRVFDPFFTTKEVGKGTGLGLSICYGIIEEHGGEIRAVSSQGDGTTMIIELPTGQTTSGGDSQRAA